MLGRVGGATATEHVEVEIEDESPEENAEAGEEAHTRLQRFTTPLLHLRLMNDAGSH